MNTVQKPRKSLFYQEKQQNPSGSPQNGEPTQADQIQTISQEDPYALFTDSNSRNNLFSSFPPPTKTDTPPAHTRSESSKSLLRPIPTTPTAEHAKLETKNITLSFEKSPKGVKRPQTSIQVNGQDINLIDSPNHVNQRSPSTLEKNRPSLSNLANIQTGKFTPNMEDEKEQFKESLIISEGEKTFMSPNDLNELISELSDEEEDEQNMPLERLLVRKRLRKFLYASYFMGIAITLQNRIRLYGTLKPIEDTKRMETEEKVTKTRGVFPLMPSNNFRVAWTMVLVVLIFLTTLLTPYNISFIEDDDHTFKVINLVFDIAFGIDIVLNFISAYYDPVNGLVTDFKSIAIQYIRLWFWIDLVAIIPFDQVVSAITSEQKTSVSTANINKLLRLLRFPRLYRLFKVLRLFKMLKLFSTSTFFNKVTRKLNLNVGILKMLKFCVNIFFMNHFVGCLWFYTTKLDDFGPDTWVAKHGMVDSDAWTQYIASYYWALQTLTTVGFGDFVPGTPVEKIIAILWMIVGVGVYSFTIGNLSSILANMDRRATILKKKLSAFNNFASKVKLPEFLRQKVQRFFELNHKENVYYWIDPSDMLKYLPDNLKSTLLLYSYHQMIKDIEILEMNANFTASILTNLKLLKLEKREILYRQDDPSQEIYFISKGSVKMVSAYGQGIYTLVQGTYFGELELLEDSKRLCFAQACETTVVIVCDKTIFLEALKEFPDVDSKIKKVAKYRREKLTTKIAQINEEMKASKAKNEPVKRPLLKSADYFYNVLLKTGKPKPTKPKKTRSPSPLKATGGSPNKNKADPLESFRKLQDFTGAMDPKKSILKKLGELKRASTKSLTPGKPDSPEQQPRELPRGRGMRLIGLVANENKNTSDTGKETQENPVKGPIGVKKFRRPSYLKSVSSVMPKVVGEESPEEKKTDGNVFKPKENILPPAFLEGNKQGSPQQSTHAAFSLAQTLSPAQTAHFLDPNSPELNKGKKSLVPSLVINEVDERKDGDKTTDDRSSRVEENFANYVHSLEQKEENLRQKIQNLNSVMDKTSYLNIVREGLNEFHQLKEKVEVAYSDIDNKKQSVVQNFTTIAERQKDINLNVEKLFSISTI